MSSFVNAMLGLLFVESLLPIIQNSAALHSCKNGFCLEAAKALVAGAFQ
ncbi:MAG: hypothetical protein ACI4NJ_00830 [Cellvibrio sp.]